MGVKIQLQAWRTTGKNPCDDPPVKITIAPVEKGTQVYPWIIPLERAVEMFGQDRVDFDWGGAGGGGASELDLISDA